MRYPVQRSEICEIHRADLCIIERICKGSQENREDLSDDKSALQCATPSDEK